jgi:hypothetical protein
MQQQQQQQQRQQQQQQRGNGVRCCWDSNCCGWVDEF